MSRLLFTLILTLIISGLCAQDSIYDILNFTKCTGIEVSGEPELYVGDDLFSLINGGAELYHEYGFVEVLAAKVIPAGKDPIKIEIYDMGSSEASWGIFSMTATGSASSLEIGGQARKGEGFLQFIKGKYMVYIYFGEAEETETRRITNCIADNISESGEKPKLMKAVDTNIDYLEKVYYFMGNLGLSNVYNFHYKDVFSYKEGAAAIYPDLKVILLRYEDEEQCIEHFNEAKEFFMKSSKYHEQLIQRGSFHMKDRKRQEIDCYYENQFLIIFISDGGIDLNSIREDLIENIQE